MLIIGATGATGRELVRRAEARGRTVTALIRDPGDRALFPATVPTVVGDVLDPASLRSALDGHHEVVSALGVRLGTPPGSVRSTGTANLVAAMTDTGVRRLVAVSTVGVGSSRADQTRLARLLWPRLVGADRLAEAALSEDAITSSDRDWTIVRPPRLLDGPAGAATEVGAHVRLPLSAQLTRADLAAVLLDCLADPATIGATLTAVSRR